MIIIALCVHLGIWFVAALASSITAVNVILESLDEELESQVQFIEFSSRLFIAVIDSVELPIDENIALRSAVQQSYRKAFPKGAVVDAEKQLSRKLVAMRGSGQTSGFVSLMELVGGVIADMPGTSIATINYNDKGDEMRMNIVAADFEGVEQVRARINKAGLQAVMESSSAQGDRVRARLRVGKSS